MRKGVLVAVGLVLLVLASFYWSQVLCAVVAIILVGVPLRIAGLLGERLGTCLDAEIERRRYQDELVRLLLQHARRERGR